MSSKKILEMLLFIIGLLLGIVALLFTYTGLPWTFDTEPLLAIGLVLVAFAGIISAME
jgi:hypothetical protein